MAADSADVVIIGAGIIGLCSALAIAKHSSLRVVVIEKGTAIGEGSTGASSAVCRARYTRDEMVVLAQEGIDAYRHWGDFLGLSDPSARLHAPGVLWIGSGDPLDKEIARLGCLGVRVECLDDGALAERFPAINPCPITPDLDTGAEHVCIGGGGHLLEVEGGYVDPMDALSDVLRAVRERGVEVRLRTEATAIAMSGGTVSAVGTTWGPIGCGAVVDAAGPWCDRIYAQAGLASPWTMAPTRIQIVHVDRPPGLVGELPVCADGPGGIYFRPQNRGQQIVIGSVLEQDEREAVNPDEFDRGVDDDFAAAKLHALQHRLPGLRELRGVRGYSGLYTINRDDVHPVIGATPLGGFFVANGFSGHGFKVAPAIGSLVAEAVLDARLTDERRMLHEFLAFDRRPIAVTSKSVLA